MLLLAWQIPASLALLPSGSGVSEPFAAVTQGRECGRLTGEDAHAGSG